MNRSIAALFAYIVSASTAFAQAPPAPPAPNPATPSAPAAETAAPDKAALYKALEKSLSGAKLVGRFTLFGQEDKEAIKEEYTINSVTKLPDGDYWLFKARIKYGDKDLTIPLPLEVKWAGDTPVITLTDFTIPGMGTFSARVVIYRDVYAGWWQHGKAGGHMFGTVEKLTDEKKPEQASPAPASNSK